MPKAYPPLNLPPIVFYLPKEADLHEELPTHSETFWQGFNRGIYCWTLKTYLYLKERDFPCQLSAAFPSEGIVLAHRDCLPDTLPSPSPNLLLICLKAERDPHPAARIHIVQNPQECRTLSSIWNPHFIPLWHQQGLLPRDPERGDRFENIAFFGNPRNLSAEFHQQAWIEDLKNLGLNWFVKSSDCWHDYRDIDATFSVRSLKNKKFSSKPATKLYNSWLAGVPAILGRESAFRAERKSELDYVEIKSYSEAIAALTHLRENPELRRAMIERGKLRSQEFLPENIVHRWESFLLETAVPAYQHWQTLSSFQRKKLYRESFVRLKAMRLRARFTEE
ncbi:hypothetical protein [Oscillatoria sp. FACHB-1406]|uniref:hypothetical protein n=1 Tax=Oscillatoria sp. FACHB-1406 TaxID=2692846 RepID=UPI001687F830|nr:hypothetical protein [Oscillatoria sp. FACHB-1406]MBD2577976.1 hypothetical protein [Oscillatoria sp. FACHB-1406]